MTADQENDCWQESRKVKEVRLKIRKTVLEGPEISAQKGKMGKKGKINEILTET